MRRALRIGVDAHYVGTAACGVETYTVNLLQALARIDARNSYTVYVVGRHGAALGLNGCPNFGLHPLWTNRSWIRLPVNMPAAILRRPVDVLHVHYAAPPFCPVPFVATIYDLSIERFPEFVPRLHPHRATRIISRTARRASKIITISENSKADLLELFHLPPEKIVVTPLGVHPRFRPAERADMSDTILHKYRIQRPFILYVGYIQASKNLVGLIQAFTALKLQSPVPHQLVVVGREHYQFQEIYRARDRSPVREQIVFVGYVPDEDLVPFYQAADLFVLPSFYEGFGLPVLEAMACGTPVMAARTSSLPEVVGEGGLLVDPHNVSQMVEAMSRILHEPTLRKDLREKGLRRAREYSWDRTAGATLAVYEEVGARVAAAKERG
jgi:glycosyltransferase involved in cell wall biosynthesis